MTKFFYLLLIAVLLFSGCTGGTPAITPSSTTTITFIGPPPELPPATVGEFYSYSFATDTDPSGGNPPYTFSLGSESGFAPLGLVMDLNGKLSGTPMVEGTSSFEVCVKDLSGNRACRKTSLEVKLIDLSK